MAEYEVMMITYSVYSASANTFTSVSSGNIKGSQLVFLGVVLRVLCKHVLDFSLI